MQDNRLRILLVEDNKGDAALVKEYVDEAFGAQAALQRAETLQQGQQLLLRWKPQVVLLDLNLPDSKGFATLESFCDLRDAPGLTRPPIIVMTSLDDQDMAMQAVSGCAHDYLIKNDVNPQVLLKAIRFAIARHGKDTVDKILQEPGHPEAAEEAIEVIERVNRTTPGDGAGVDVADGTPAGLYLQQFATGSRATEVVLRELHLRIKHLEEAKHAYVIDTARREADWGSIEKLLRGNGKGPLATRLELIERQLAGLGDLKKEHRHGKTFWGVTVGLVLVAYVTTLVVWAVVYLGGPR